MSWTDQADGGRCSGGVRACLTSGAARATASATAPAEPATSTNRLRVLLGGIDMRRAPPRGRCVGPAGMKGRPRRADRAPGRGPAGEALLAGEGSPATL